MVKKIIILAPLQQNLLQNLQACFFPNLVCCFAHHCCHLPHQRHLSNNQLLPPEKKKKSVNADKTVVGKTLISV